MEICNGWPQWATVDYSCPCSSHVAMSNVASSGEQEEGRVSPPSTSGNAQLIPPEPASVRCEVEKVVLCMIWGSLSSGSGMVTVQVEELKFPISLSCYSENMELRFLHSGSWCVETFFDVCQKIHSPKDVRDCRTTA